MIIVLEGVNGAGKTALCSWLATVGVRKFKPFRPIVDDGHWNTEAGKQLYARWAALGVEVNSHVEDLFSADFLGRFPELNVVLDRSVPSAWAYDSIPPGVSAPDVLEAWISALDLHKKVVYVTMTASYEAVIERTGLRAPTQEQYELLKRRLDYVHRQIEIRANWCMGNIDTTHISKAETIEAFRHISGV